VSTVEYNPFDVAADVPIDALRALRNECPVARIDVGWLLTRHEHVKNAVRDVDSFRTSYREPGVVVPEEEQLLPEMPEPRHGKVRRIVNAVVGWHKAQRMEPFIRALSHEYLDTLLERGEGDLVADFAAPIPINVMAEMLGVPRVDWALFRQWSDEVVQGEYVNKNRTARGEGFGGGHPEFASYVDDLIRSRTRRDDRRDDMVTRLIHTEVDGLRLTPVEIRTQLISLILGGNETTRHLLANILARLATTPVLLEQLHADPQLIGAVVEESLRLEPPIHQMIRTVEKPLDRFGPSMCPGDKIVYAVASANRDVAVFDGPDEWRLDRENGRDHLAFGDGPHICPGQAIARLEGIVTTEVFVERVGRLGPLDGWRYRKVPVFWANGPIDVRVSLAAR
jgi:cytochrome P450